MVLKTFGVENGAFCMVSDAEFSILGQIGSFLAPVFIPMGFGTWQAARWHSFPVSSPRRWWCPP